MQTLNLSIETNLVGQGKERNCFVHPLKPDKAIKITHGPITKQTERELKFYRSIKRRKNVSYKHIPYYYGQINTNFGTGHMFQLVRDYDGNVSKSMLWYLQKGYSLEYFEKKLQKLQNYLMANQIIFNHDMYSGNILYKRKSASKGRLVIIDGLGDTVYLSWLNIFQSHRSSKIRRRWQLFIDRLKERTTAIQSRSIDNNQISTD